MPSKARKKAKKLNVLLKKKGPIKKKKKVPIPRKRTDTFWANSDEDNAEYFGRILDGEHDKFYLNQSELIKEDYKGRKRHCWRVYNKSTNVPVTGIRSTRTYRLSLLWSIYSCPSFWRWGSHLHRLKSHIKDIKSKKGDHCRHRCGNDWCCNPCHILIGTRVDNEVDKHFHYFLNHDLPSVREKFRRDFKDLMKKQSVWWSFAYVR
jgi:hypothetical protein